MSKMPRTAAAAPSSNLGVPGSSKGADLRSSRRDAGDVSDVSDRSSSVSSGNRGESVPEQTKYPENIHKCINALRNLHMDARKKEVESQVTIFKAEADLYRSLEKVWKKRAEFISGKSIPSEQESKFSLSEKDMQPDTSPDDGQKGIPKFWLVVLNYAAHTADKIQPQDIPVLEHLKDVRVEYKDRPVGFTLVFDFAPNPFFSNTTLTRSFEYDSNLSPAQLYSSNGFMPTSTAGCTINWKEGKDVTRKPRGESPSKGDKKLDSFFDLFSPSITDLNKIGQMLAEDDGDDLMEQAEQAGLDYEIATSLRLRIIPRALLYYTGEADTDGVESDFSEDYSYSEESDEEGGGRGKRTDESDADEARTA